MCLREKQKCARQAFTLVELTAVVGITAILASLLLLGVSAARESARKVQCSNNLKQIGLALHNYESNHKVLPRGVNANEAGPLVAILPFIDFGPLFDQIDFQRSMSSQEAIVLTKVPLFRCPSTEEQDRPRVDYGLNRGVTLAKNRLSPWYFEERVYPMLNGYSRGLTATPLFSEICPRIQRRRPGWILRFPSFQIDVQSDSEQFARECEQTIETRRESRLDNGFTWVGSGDANYYHILSPFGNSCDNNGAVQKSIFSTTSMHNAGCNLLYADGRVELTSPSIDLSLWKTLGSR